MIINSNMENKMKQFKLIIAITCLVSVNGYCQDMARKPQVKDMLDEDIRVRIMSNMLARTGGYLTVPSTGKIVLVLNAQTKVEHDKIKIPVDEITKFVKLATSIRKISPKESMSLVTEAKTEAGVGVVIAVVDDPRLPTMLVAPESNWAIVNVAQLGSKNVEDDILALRTQKEIWRAFGYVMGAAHSTGPVCLMKTVLSLGDLDTLKPKTLSPEPFGKITEHAKRIGVKNVHLTTYRKACLEGWAPAPTNSIQKTIWEEVKADKK